MMLLGVKACLTLLWGISVLFSMETKSASIPDASSSSNSTAEPDKADRPLTTAHAPQNEIDVRSETLDPTHNPAEVAVTEIRETAVSPTGGREEAVVSTESDSSNPLLHTSAAVTTGASDARPSNNTTVSEAAAPEDQSMEQSSISSADISAPPTTSTAPSAPATVFSPQLTSTTKPDVTTKLSPSTASDNSTDKAPHLVSRPSASSTTTVTSVPTPEATPVFHPTSSPVTTTEVTTASAELSSTPQPISHTRNRVSTSPFPGTTGLSSTTSSTNESHATTASNDSTSTSAPSTSPVFIPHVPKRSPVSTATPTPATTAAPREVSKSPSSTEVQPCSTRRVVKQCLIVVASLAGLATIFMVSTIVLCAKLSARKYKVKRPQPATEMMCISALLPERSYTYARQRNPISNGVLVIPCGGDSDEDGGDNLTLSSFLPENDRYV